MSELLSGWTALPNLHPALVHFPIAPAVVALFIDGLSLLLRQREEWGSVTAVLYVLAALGSVATCMSGREAAASVAGRHLKSWVGDTLVVHGNGSSGDKGAVGLLLDGRGEVRVVELSVQPATGPE